MAILGRLFHIQILQSEQWRVLAQGQQRFFVPIKKERGEIFINNGETLIPLAVNKKWQLVYISPAEINKNTKNKEEIAETLGKILNIDKESILEKIENSEGLYQLVKNKLTQREIEDIKKVNLQGVYLGKEILRYYPQETLASHVIGFVGGKSLGQYGIEEYYNDFLEGLKNPRSIKKSAGLIEKGPDIVLTLDYNIQFMAEKLLKEAKEELDIREGTIIVGDPNSGKIIALANFPSFNPNQYSKEKDLTIFQNSAIQKLFEPGSVFKPITMAAALDLGKITPQTKYVDKGFVKIGGYKIYNYGKRVWGERTMTEVLEKSINTGAIFAERQIGNKVFLDYAEKFGLFEPTGIDLQGEVFSANSNLKKGYEVNFATASFGQGIEITPIQLFRAISVIANGGKLIKPYLVKEFNQNNQNTKRIISQKTASQLTAMMVSVIENGFGKSARIPGYYVAGKTGTAQISWSALGVNKPGYSQETVQTFVGFAPAFDPKLLIVVKLDNPKTKTSEYSAAPIFKKLANYIIDYWQIPPDYQEEK